MADLFAMLQAAAGNAGEDVDPDFANTVLLLHGDGTNGAQNNTFLDSSTNNFTITRNGNTTQGSFSPFSKPDGRWGNSFLGDTDYITCTSNAAYQLNTGDFTIECWLYTTALVGNVGKVFQYATDGNFSSGGYGLAQETNINTLTWGRSTGVVTLTSAAPTNEWFHLAIVHSSGTLTAYLNGVSVFSAADSYNYNYGGAHPFAIGSGRNGAGNFTDDYTGYISNFRVVKGTAVYTGAFTPSTTPLTAIANTSLLTCQSNRFVDNSTNAFAITAVGPPKVTLFSPFPLTTEYSPSVNGGSGYFDGSGDYLSIANNAAFNFGAPSGNTNDFVVEGWFYPTTTSITFPIGTGYVSATYWALQFNRNSGTGANDVGKIGLYLTDSTVLDTTTSSGFLPFQWNHVAAVRTGTTVSIFVNGVRQATTTTSQNPNPTGALQIGKDTVLNRDFSGWMSGIRILKGSTIPYDATITTLTLPSAPPTAITNTQVLTNFTNAGIYDNTGFNVLETVGNAQIDTTTKKYGTGSLEFDGTGDWLLLPSTPEITIGSGDFTVECWINPSVLAGAVRTFIGGDSAGALLVSIASTGSALQVNPFGSGDIINAAFSFSTGTWYHIAVTRSGTDFRAFVNGTQVGTTVTNSTNFSGPNNYVGSAGASNQLFTGFIDDLRITKGVARYTTTFTPPTKAFPNVGA